MSIKPPKNFAIVEDGLYRSGYPTPANVPYLRRLGLRSLVLLSMEALPRRVIDALRKPSTNPALPSVSVGDSSSASSGAPSYQHQTLQVFHLGQCAWTTHDEINASMVKTALHMILTGGPSLFPMLVCCPFGDAETSAAIGCLRKCQRWCLSSVMHECELFAPCPALTPGQQFSTALQHGSYRAVLELVEAFSPFDFLRDVYAGVPPPPPSQPEEQDPSSSTATTTTTTIHLPPAWFLASLRSYEEELTFSVQGAHSTSSGSWRLAAMQHSSSSSTVDSPVLKSGGEVPTASRPSTGSSSALAQVVAERGLVSARAAIVTAVEQHRLDVHPPLLGPRSAFNATQSIVDEDDD